MAEKVRLTLTGSSSQNIMAYWRSFPGWKLKLAQPLHGAVYNAAVGMTDDEIEAVVKDALIRARRALSS